MRDQAGPASGAAAAATRSSSAVRRRSTAARSPRSTPPASRRSTRRSSPCPRGSATWRGTTSTPWRAALDPTCRGRAARAGAGRGRREPGHGRVLRRRAPAVRRAGRLVHGRRGADRPRPHRTLVRLPALRRRARRRHDGQGARQRRAHRRLLGPGRGRRGVPSRATTPPRSAASPCDVGGTRGARRDGARGRRPRRPSGPAHRLTDGVAGDCPAWPNVRGLGLLLAAELEPTGSMPRSSPTTARRRARRQRGHADGAAPRPVRCS